MTAPRIQAVQGQTPGASGASRLIHATSVIAAWHMCTSQHDSQANNTYMRENTRTFAVCDEMSCAIRASAIYSEPSFNPRRPPPPSPPSKRF